VRAAEAVQQFHRSRAFRLIARSGWAVTGLLHIIIGTLAIAVALGAHGVDPDEVGAFTALASAPLGEVLLVVTIVALLGLGSWMLGDAILNGGPRRRWTSAVSSGMQGLIYLALTVPPAVLLLGGELESGRTTRAVSEVLLDSVPGMVLLVLIGLGIGAAGVYFIIKGIRRRFWWEIRSLPRRRGRAIRALGVVGYVARGIAFILLGALIVVESLQLDPADITGLAGALSALHRGLLGPVWLSAIGAGLIIYGIYGFARARLSQVARLTARPTPAR
jgi:hypothetical protein